MTSASSAPTVWYFPDLETRFACLCGIWCPAQSARCTGERRGADRFIQIKQNKDTCCILVEI